MPDKAAAEAWVLATTEAARQARQDAKDYGTGFLMVDHLGNWTRVAPWRVTLRDET